MTEKKKFGFKESILVTTFLGFIGGLLLFIWTQQTTDIHYFKIIITIWVITWTIMLIFGFNRGSIFAFGAALIKIASDKTITNQEKIALIMITIQDWANLAANWKMIEETKKEVKKIEPIE